MTVKIEDSGVIGGEKQLNDVLDELRVVTKKAVVADVPVITHWWLLRQADGLVIAYFGTPESFAAKVRRV